MTHVLIFGLGYTGLAVARAARDAGFTVSATFRDAARAASMAEWSGIPFIAAGEAVAAATHVLITAPPEQAGDPVLARHAAAIRAAPELSWIGYMSTTGVYGNRDGGWVDEDTPPAPVSDRTRRRVAAEQAWTEIGAGKRVDLLRLAGIYGPGRSVFDDLRAGTARRIVKPGHAFGRIHRDDIANAVLTAMRQDRAPGTRVLNLTDEEPAESAAVIAEAARLLEMEPPPAVPFAEAIETMSPMARSFWAENRKVASRKTQAALGIAWRYPTYREGLRAVLEAERGASASVRADQPKP